MNLSRHLHSWAMETLCHVLMDFLYVFLSACFRVFAKFPSNCQYIVAKYPLIRPFERYVLTQSEDSVFWRKVNKG
jgi:hypothetical protein